MLKVFVYFGVLNIYISMYLINLKFKVLVNYKFKCLIFNRNIKKYIVTIFFWTTS